MLTKVFGDNKFEKDFCNSIVKHGWLMMVIGVGPSSTTTTIPETLTEFLISKFHP